MPRTCERLIQPLSATFMAPQSLDARDLYLHAKTAGHHYQVQLRAELCSHARPCTDDSEPFRVVRSSRGSEGFTGWIEAKVGSRQPLLSFAPSSWSISKPSPPP